MNITTAYKLSAVTVRSFKSNTKKLRRKALALYLHVFLKEQSKLTTKSLEKQNR